MLELEEIKHYMKQCEKRKYKWNMIQEVGDYLCDQRLSLIYISLHLSKVFFKKFSS